jgi:hypothetical protein
MTFEEWSQWFLSLEGMKEVLEMRPHGPIGKQAGKFAQNTSMISR